MTKSDISAASIDDLLGSIRRAIHDDIAVQDTKKPIVGARNGVARRHLLHAPVTHNTRAGNGHSGTAHREASSLPTNKGKRGNKGGRFVRSEDYLTMSEKLDAIKNKTPARPAWDPISVKNPNKLSKNGAFSGILGGDVRLEDALSRLSKAGLRPKPSLLRDSAEDEATPEEAPLRRESIFSLPEGQKPRRRISSSLDALSHNQPSHDDYDNEPEFIKPRNFEEKSEELEELEKSEEIGETEEPVMLHQSSYDEGEAETYSDFDVSTEPTECAEPEYNGYDGEDENIGDYWCLPEHAGAPVAGYGDDAKFEPEFDEDYLSPEQEETVDAVYPEIYPQQEEHEQESQYMAEPRNDLEAMPLEQTLLSVDSNAAVTAAFNQLNDTMMHQVNSSDTTLQPVVRTMLRPMLKKWLDTNLPELVEKIVHEEISRIAGRQDK